MHFSTVGRAHGLLNRKQQSTHRIEWDIWDVIEYVPFILFVGLLLIGVLFSAP